MGKTGCAANHSFLLISKIHFSNLFQNDLKIAVYLASLNSHR